MDARQLHDAAAYLAETIPEDEVSDDLVDAPDMETRWLLTLAALNGSRDLVELAARLAASDPRDARLQEVCGWMSPAPGFPYVTVGLLGAMTVVLLGFAGGMAATAELVVSFEAELVAHR